MLARSPGRSNVPLRSSLAIIASALALLGPSPAQAAFTVTGSGTNAETGGPVAASATFAIAGDILTLVLTNTSPTPTPVRGDVLQGIAFDIAGPNPTLSLANVALTAPGNDAIFTGKTASNASDPLNGSYTNALGSSPVAEFGVSSTGFDGGFAAGTISRGNGGTDYGIVSNGTFPNGGASNSFNSAFPLIQNSLTFTFTGIAGVDESRIAGVRFLFGTDGSGIIPAQVQAVPEPSSLAMVGLASACCGLAVLRRRRASAA